jgi:hypothetical protein
VQVQSHRSFSDSSTLIQKPVEVEQIMDEGLSNLHDVGSTISSMSRDSIKKLILEVKNGTYQDTQGHSYLYANVNRGLSDKLSNAPLSVALRDYSPGSEKGSERYTSDRYTRELSTSYEALESQQPQQNDVDHVGSIDAVLAVDATVVATDNIAPVPVQVEPDSRNVGRRFSHS